MRKVINSKFPLYWALKLIWCINHFACDLPNCQTTCWQWLSRIELKNFGRVQRRKYDTIVNILIYRRRMNVYVRRWRVEVWLWRENRECLPKVGVFITYVYLVVQRLSPGLSRSHRLVISCSLYKPCFNWNIARTVLVLKTFTFLSYPILHPTSSILHPTSSILHPTSSILHPTSYIQHPASYILHLQHPTSSIQHPTSSILHQNSIQSYPILSYPAKIFKVILIETKKAVIVLI